MNAIPFLQPILSDARAAAWPAAATVARLPAPTSHTHRERDFGVGYGNSSGYASARRYANGRQQPGFRCH